MTATNDKLLALDQVLERVVAVTGARYDAAVARELGVTPQTLSSWRKRGTVPFEVVTAFALKRGLSLDYMLLGKGSSLWAGGEIDPALAEAIALEFGAVVEETKARDLELFPSWPLLGYRLALIYNRVIKRARPGDKYGDIIADEVRFLRDVAIQESKFGHPPRAPHPEELAHWKKLGISPSEILGAGQQRHVARNRKNATAGSSKPAPKARGGAPASPASRKK